MNQKRTNFTIGVITGVILTLLGSFIQFYLQKEFYNYNENKRTAILTCKFLDSRLHRSISIVEASGSNVFSDRWNAYINEVIYPWNSNLFLMDVFIQQEHEDCHKEFEYISEQFRELHKLLNEIRKKQGTISSEAKDELNHLEKESKVIIEKLTKSVKDIKSELLE